MCYEFNDYVVEITCNVRGNTIIHNFDVMAYSENEAEDLALAEFSKLNYDHTGTLKYNTCLWDEHADREYD